MTTEANHLGDSESKPKSFLASLKAQHEENRCKERHARSAARQRAAEAQQFREELGQKQKELNNLKNHMEVLRDVCESRDSVRFPVSDIGRSEKERRKVSRKSLWHHRGVHLGFAAVALTSTLSFAAVLDYLLPSQPPGVEAVMDRLDHSENSRGVFSLVAAQVAAESNHTEVVNNGADDDVFAYADMVAKEAVDSSGDFKSEVARVKMIPKPASLNNIPHLEETAVKLAWFMKPNFRVSQEQAVAEIVGPAYIPADELAKLKEIEHQPFVPLWWIGTLTMGSSVALRGVLSSAKRLQRKELNRLKSIYDEKFGSLSPSELLAIEKHNQSNTDVVKRIISTEKAIQKERARSAAIAAQRQREEQEASERANQAARERLEAEVIVREQELERVRREQKAQESRRAAGVASWGTGTFDGSPIESSSVQDTVRVRSDVQDVVQRRSEP